MPVIVTAWRPTPEELVKINLGHPLYLMFFTNALPPHSVLVDSPFEEPAKESET